MKPRAILFVDVSWAGDAMIPVIRYVAERGYVPVVRDYTKSGRPREESFIYSVQAAGIPCLDWDTFLPPSSDEAASRWSVEQIQQLALNLRDLRQLPPFASRRGHFLTKTAQPFLQSLQLRLRDNRMQTDTLRTLQEQMDVRLMVMGFDTLDHSRAILAVAKQLAIPTLAVPHGHTNNDLSGLHGLLRALEDRGGAGSGWRPPIRLGDAGSTFYTDRIAVHGSLSRQALEAWGADGSRIYETGAPSMDAFCGLLAPATEQAETRAARQALGLDPDTPVLLYLASYAHGNTPAFSIHIRHCLDLHRAILAVRHRMKDAIQVVVRPHPHEMVNAPVSAEAKQAVDAQYRRWLDAQGLEGVHLVRSEKVEAIRAADVVVSTEQSSAVPEIMVAGRPVVGVPVHPEAGLLYGPALGLEIALRPGDVPDVVERLVRDPGLRQAVVDRQWAALPKLNAYHDGLARWRLAHLIFELAEGAAPDGRTWTSPAAADLRRLDNAWTATRRAVAAARGDVEGACAAHRWSEAMNRLETERARYPREASVYLCMADVLERMGRYGDVAGLLESARAAWPFGLAPPDILRRAAEAFHRLGAHDRAARCYQEALHQAPNDYALLVGAGQVHIERGAHRDAFAVLRHAVRLRPDEAEAWLGLVLVTRHLNDPQHFNVARRKVLELAPTHPSVAHLLDA